MDRTGLWQEAAMLGRFVVEAAMACAVILFLGWWLGG